MPNSSALDAQEIEQRLITLETKVAYQEKTIADLNDVVVAQARLLDSFELRMKRLEQQLQSPALEEHQRETPPHY